MWYNIIGGDMLYNESAKRATMKYIRENLEEVRFRVKKGDKERYKAHAERQGKSLTGLIVDLLEQDIQNAESKNRE